MADGAGEQANLCLALRGYSLRQGLADRGRDLSFAPGQHHIDAGKRRPRRRPSSPFFAVNARMRPYDPKHHLDTNEGLLAQYRQRSLRRIHFSIDGIEPRAKHSMAEADKDEVQRQLLECLVDLRRKAFRGPLALRLTLATTEKTPTHSHHIAKNLLDLFGKTRPALATRRRNLLYADDCQIRGLAVTCHHGESAPMISAVASPLGSLLADLDLAVNSDHQRRDDDDRWEQSMLLDRAIDEVRDMLRGEAEFRRTFGDRAFETMLRFARQQAQEHMLGRAAVAPLDLAKMYNVSGRALGIDFAEIWEQTFASTPLRILLSELPQVKGASMLWKEEIDAKLRDFQSRLGWLIDPLLVPVALEAVIKPPPPSRQNNLHDLDNVLRTYLIPRVIDILEPVSDYAFTLDEEALRRDAPELFSNPRSSWHNGISRPPASTKAGVTRYEAWRLPPANEGSQGFVSVAVVADMTGHGNTFRQIDDEIEDWQESLDGRSYLGSRRRRRF